MRAAEVIKQLLICGRLLKGIEIGAVQVLQKGIAQQVIIGDLPHDCRDLAESREFRRSEAALTHDEFEALVGGGTHHDWLENAYFPDGGRKLFEVFFVKDLAWLARVR